MPPEKPQAPFAIYQTKDGALQLKTDADNETIWASQKDLTLLYEKDQSVISRHIRNIFKDNEVDEKSNMQFLHIAHSDKPVAYYSLDIILAVGYRTNSSRAIAFRKWATQTLKQHITKGFTINQHRLQQNHQEFLQAVEDVKQLIKDNKTIQASDILELIKSFAPTWLTLDCFDKNSFPQKGTQTEIQISAEKLQQDLEKLKLELIDRKEATDLFAQEKKSGNLKGIIGNVFQTIFGEDAYPSVEQKAAHLLYFIVKNYSFNDGNKRSAAFAFIWFLQKAGFNFTKKISPETLATLTILIAESNPNDQEKMIGIVMLLLHTKI